MTFTCSVCGGEHDGLPALTFLGPDPWRALHDDERAKGKCDEDLCATPDGRFFIRCVLVVPINDGPEPTLEYGVWASVNEESFWRYVETFNDEPPSQPTVMLGRLANELRRPFEGSENLQGLLLPQSDGQRPWIELDASDHPLFLAQRNGISFESAQKIAHDHTAK